VPATSEEQKETWDAERESGFDDLQRTASCETVRGFDDLSRIASCDETVSGYDDL